MSDEVVMKRTRRPKVEGALAQEQLMEAVDDLFYREGARMVGIDAVVKRAGLNKMALYRQFKSKEGLLLHYLARKETNFWSYIDASLQKHLDSPRQQLLQIFIDLAARASRPGYRGCPFVNIAVEFPEPSHAARAFVAEHKSKLLARLVDLATLAGARHPVSLAKGLALLIDGAYAASQTYGSGDNLLAELPNAAEILINSALTPA